jgi:nucleotide-binding universal stress UspA family protein
MTAPAPYSGALTAGRVIVGSDGADTGADAVALGQRLADILATPVDVVSADGGPERVLADVAAAEQAGVIVLGHTHRQHLARVLSGTARRVLRSTPCPIAIAPLGYAGRAPAAIRRIGVGYEPTPEATAALALARDLAARAGGDLRAVGVALPLAPLAADDPRDRSPYLEAEELTVRAGLTRAVGELPAGVPTVVDARIGSPGGELVAASDDLDLLVCGSRRQSPLRALLLGSVTERLLAEAACPVLIVPLPADAGKARRDDAGA